MITCLVFLGMIYLMIRVFMFGLRATWSIVKILFSVLLIPIVVLGFLAVGLVGVVILLAVIGGIGVTLMRRPL